MASLPLCTVEVATHLFGQEINPPHGKSWKSDLAFRGGQEPIVHLVSSVERTLEFSAARPLAFTDGNAGTQFTSFFTDLDLLPTEVDWNSVKATDWRDPAVKERKQAEFLVHDSFPWEGFVGIGVMNQKIELQVNQLLAGAAHQPQVKVCPTWYY